MRDGRLILDLLRRWKEINVSECKTVIEAILAQNSPYFSRKLNCFCTVIASAVGNK